MNGRQSLPQQGTDSRDSSGNLVAGVARYHLTGFVWFHIDQSGHAAGQGGLVSGQRPGRRRRVPVGGDHLVRRKGSGRTVAVGATVAINLTWVRNPRRVTARRGQLLGGFMNNADAKQEPRPRTTVRSRLRQKAQLTLPDEVRQLLHVGEGDEVEFTVEADGRVTVRGYVSVPTDQAWFFTPERHAGKRQADDEIAMGSGTVHDSGEAMFAHLDNLSAGES